VRLALDTNAYGAAARGDSKAVALLRAADRLVLPFVVLAELRFDHVERGRRLRIAHERAASLRASHEVPSPNVHDRSPTITAAQMHADLDRLFGPRWSSAPLPPRPRAAGQPWRAVRWSQG